MILWLRSCLLGCKELDRKSKSTAVSNSMSSIERVCKDPKLRNSARHQNHPYSFEHHSAVLLLAKQEGEDRVDRCGTNATADQD